MTKLNIGDRPILIRWCKGHRVWHIIRVVKISGTFYMEVAYSAIDFSDILLILNFKTKQLRKMIKSSRYGKFGNGD